MKIEFIKNKYVIIDSKGKVRGKFNTYHDAKFAMKRIRFVIQNKKHLDKGLQVIPFSKMATLPVSTKVRNDYADYDYVKTLSKDEVEWLTAFNREYYNADFKHKGPKIFKDKEQISFRYGENNARNRDSYAITKCNGMLDILEPGWDE